MGWLVWFCSLVWLLSLHRFKVKFPFLIEGKGSVAGNSGAFTYSIPIEVPPGRHGLTPQLSLVYNSSAGNGFLGVGWDLPIGYVMRSTKYGVDYNCNPATSPNPCFFFMLGGASSELIRRTDWCSDCYGARVEGAFMRFRFVSNSYWEVTDKSGTKYLLGQTAASRQDGTPGVFKWMLNTVIDTRNNTVSYTYFKDQGQLYIGSIDYQANHIVFNRTGRTDIESGFTPNFAVTVAYKLDSIEIYSNWSGGSGTKIRKYRLEYCGAAGVTCAASGTVRSLLGKVTQYGSDWVATLPASSFNWLVAGNGFLS